MRVLNKFLRPCGNSLLLKTTGTALTIGQRGLLARAGWVQGGTAEHVVFTWAVSVVKRGECIG